MVAVNDGRGAMQLVFTRDSVPRMERDFGRVPLRRLHEYVDVYKIVASRGGQCLTIGHHYKHLRRTVVRSKRWPEELELRMVASVEPAARRTG